MYPSQQQQQPTGGKTTSRVITKLRRLSQKHSDKKGSPICKTKSKATKQPKTKLRGGVKYVSNQFFKPDMKRLQLEMNKNVNIQRNTF